MLWIQKYIMDTYESYGYQTYINIQTRILDNLMLIKIIYNLRGERYYLFFSFLVNPGLPRKATPKKPTRVF